MGDAPTPPMSINTSSASRGSLLQNVSEESRSVKAQTTVVKQHQRLDTLETENVDLRDCADMLRIERDRLLQENRLLKEKLTGRTLADESSASFFSWRSLMSCDYW